MRIEKALSRISAKGREAALARLNRARIDVSGEEEWRVLRHRSLGFWGSLPARECGKYRFPPETLGVAGPKGRLP